ncbi:Protein HIRA [Platanthera zijinensis]|uniref:Protein HIRA n=1 Tax=Platanthera zijinensis TaxID=2320716 RepID=A0AAP0B9H7_9ASPA
MGRPGEAADIDCATTERDKKPKKMGEDEHEEAEDEGVDEDDVDGGGRGGGGDDDDDDDFFESLDRVPSGVSFDLGHPSSGSDSDDDDDEDEDVRISFASAIEAPRFSLCVADLDDCFPDDDDVAGGFDYGIWMDESVSLTERRRRLLQGMGLRSSKDLALSKTQRDPKPAASNSFPPPLPTSASAKHVPSARAPPPLLSQSLSSPTSSCLSLARSLSDTHFPGQAPKEAGLVRSLSSPPSPWLHHVTGNNAGWVDAKAGAEKGQPTVDTDSGDTGAVACKIKSLDTGKEFVMSEVGTDGSFRRLNDVQTGLQLTMDEFDRFLGFSPIVKELMRRVNLGGDKKKNGGGNMSSTRRYSVKSSKFGGRKRGSWLKNIKFVASSVTGLISEKERDNVASAAATAASGAGRVKSLSLNGNSSDWLKVHQHGKSHKELTGLYMCQEIQAHQGSIWCMRFSSNGRFLASAGEDRSVHVWQVMESDTFSTFSLLRRQESCLSASTSAVNGSASSRLDHAKILGAYASKRTRKGSNLRSRRHSLPDYVVLPDTIFSISEAPVCSFEGHLEDVLDLSWSKSQHLLSSSMDKTVRLWDMESKACLKLFAHNDYVTCIQFNPTDDNYFISGSLDGKARLWSIPNRQVVDWSDLHEMVTAVCYTPDGQGALVGSHKGSIRFYNTSDKLSQENQIDIRNKKKKSHAKKITGFQYAPDNSSEVLVTSADSQIRVFDGASIIHKFKGFRNTSSQISASFSADGMYTVCASEDSHVYIWKREVTRSGGGGGKGKSWATTRSREYFYCKDVSVAIPWPNPGSGCEKPTIPSTSSKALGASTSSSLQSASGSDDPFPNGFPLPLLPKKSSPEQLLPPTSPDSLQTSLLGSSSLSRSLRSSANSSSAFASWRWGGSSRVAASSTESGNAWGLVVVTAGLGGNIRIYQNFGLPVRLSRQSLLF